MIPPLEYMPQRGGKIIARDGSPLSYVFRPEALDRLLADILELDDSDYLDFDDDDETAPGMES